jgi:hypothetical protein
LIFAMHAVVNFNCGREIRVLLFFTFLQMWRPWHTYGPRSSTKCEALLSARFSFANLWITKEHSKTFQRTYTIKNSVFNLASAWNSVKAKTVPQAWRKLWQAVWVLRMLRRILRGV